MRLRTYKRYPLPDKTTAKTKHARIIEAVVKVQKYAEEKNVPADSVACIVDTLAARKHELRLLALVMFCR